MLGIGEKAVTDRYFYTDPLEAAYMAKHFGMRFSEGEIYDGKGTAYACQIFAVQRFDSESIEIHCTDKGNYQFYIHPDSLALLEPIKDDLIHIVRGFCSYYKIVHDVVKRGGKVVTGIWSDGEHWDTSTSVLLHDWEIIQRDGKAFFWPEKEA